MRDQRGGDGGQESLEKGQRSKVEGERLRMSGLRDEEEEAGRKMGCR